MTCYAIDGKRGIVFDQDAVIEKQAEVQRQLHEGLSEIERTNLGLFGHLERMAAHMVALEAIVSVYARQQTVSTQSVIEIIKARITAQGLDESAASSAIDVANVLLNQSID